VIEESAATPEAIGQVTRFSCWCPKVIATIGRLPETLADRRIAVSSSACNETPPPRCSSLSSAFSSKTKPTACSAESWWTNSTTVPGSPLDAAAQRKACQPQHLIEHLIEHLIARAPLLSKFKVSTAESERSRFCVRIQKFNGCSFQRCSVGVLQSSNRTSHPSTRTGVRTGQIARNPYKIRGADDRTAPAPPELPPTPYPHFVDHFVGHFVGPVTPSHFVGHFACHAEVRLRRVNPVVSPRPPVPRSPIASISKD
jgi:hypothetical protein